MEGGRDEIESSTARPRLFSSSASSADCNQIFFRLLGSLGKGDTSLFSISPPPFLCSYTAEISFLGNDAREIKYRHWEVRPPRPFTFLLGCRSPISEGLEKGIFKKKKKHTFREMPLCFFISLVGVNGRRPPRKENRF